MTKFLLIRHGESLGNAARQLLGHTNLDLSELGYRQAQATAKALENEHIDIVYSSDLLRAFNTAKACADLHGLEVIPSKNLREVMLGEWEGQYVLDVIEKYGDMYEKEWLGSYGTFRFPGGESTVEAGVRFYNECVRIAEMNPDKTVVVAAHAAVIRSFVAKVLEIAPEDVAAKIGFPTNASVSELCYKDGKFELVEFSRDAHLTDVGITRYGA